METISIVWACHHQRCLMVLFEGKKLGRPRISWRVSVHKHIRTMNIHIFVPTTRSSISEQCQNRDARRRLFEGVDRRQKTGNFVQREITREHYIFTLKLLINTE